MNNSFYLLFCVAIATLFLCVATKPRPRKPHKQTGFISGGNPVTIDTVPYLVQVSYYGKKICGGTILSELFVLTAAHCVTGFHPDVLFIRSGSNKKNAEGDVTDVAEVKIHPMYPPLVYLADYDVAVLKTKYPIPMRGPTSYIALSVFGQARSQTANLSEWDTISPSSSAVLMTLEVEILTLNDCKQWYGELISDRMFCAKSNQSNDCKGDTGGPLVDHDRLIGIGSYGVSCKAPGVPGVFISVSRVRAFIDECTSHTATWKTS